ncbi:MAG: non-homologous end-joining DNA ligase [Actinobacteria bacterium]|nr:non-homologous end-joining DNA ligase [Actinomycetota bacterium]
MSPSREREREEIRVGRRTVALSSGGRVMFPAEGITKRELFDYYVAIGPTMLPHVKGRPVTLERFPDGIEGERFYQKEAFRHTPEWIATAELPKEKGTVRHIVLQEAATLAYLAQQNAITPHVWLSKADRPHHPDQIVWDLDPSDDDFGLVRQTALRARSLLEDLGLVAFVKTTGSRGLHVVVPIRRGPRTEEAAAFADRVGSVLVRQTPDRLTMEGRIAARQGRLFLDTWRNGYAQMVVAPYGVRAKPGAPVATPVEWSEVEDPALRPNSFTIRTVVSRLESSGDAWAGMSRSARSIREPSRTLEPLEAELGLSGATEANTRWGNRKRVR